MRYTLPSKFYSCTTCKLQMVEIVNALSPTHLWRNKEVCCTAPLADSVGWGVLHAASNTNTLRRRSSGDQYRSL